MEEEEEKLSLPKAPSNLNGNRSELAYQHSGFTKMGFESSPNKSSFTPQTNQNLGIDRESIVEHYRNLRQQQKDILSKVNMKEDLKR